MIETKVVHAFLLDTCLWLYKHCIRGAEQPFSAC
jgi:hypothetical protein